MGSPARRAIVIGMDGASMQLARNMAAAGHAPNLAALMRHLEQAMANDDHIAKLSRKAREEVQKPSRC